MGRGLDGFFDLPVCWTAVQLSGPGKGSRPHGAPRAAGGRGWFRQFGGTGVGETPLPIPNREVKPHSADGTCPLWGRESRSPPVSYPHSEPPTAARLR